jgi:protein O-mannosyl-transferase
VLRGEFVWDDLILVEKNPLVTGEFTARSIWFQTDFPLSTVALWGQWLLWGNSPSGYHVVNVLLHALNALLVWRVLTRLGVAGAWLAALLFAVHPVGAASAAWISEIKNTLSLMFFLAGLWCYLRFDARAAPMAGWKTRPWYWLSLACFFLALTSKTSTVMLPVVLLGCAWWRRSRVTWRDWLHTSPHFALALAFGLMTVWFQPAHGMGGEPVQSLNFWGRLAGAGWALWFYLIKALFPANLCMIYPRWEIDPASAWSYLPGVLWCGLLVLFWRFRRTWGRPLFFGLGCFTVTLFPVLGFFDMYFMVFSRVSDHLQYLPLVAVTALMAAGFHARLPALVQRWLPVPLVLVLALLTVQRARVFATDEGLWVDTLARNPAAWNAHNNLGAIRAEQQRLGEAMRHFQTALEHNPRNAGAHVNLARALSLQGRFLEAEPHFQAALKLRPGDADTHAQYGAALAEASRREPAIQHLRTAVRLKPKAETHLQLAILFRATSDTRAAMEHCRAALALQPDLPPALSNLAWMLATAADQSLRDGPEAVRLAKRACQLTGFQDARMVGTLAAAFAEAGRFDEAVTTAQQAVDLATAAGDVAFAQVNRQLLQLYRAGRPYHETPASR